MLGERNRIISVLGIPTFQKLIFHPWIETNFFFVLPHFDSIAEVCQRQEADYFSFGCVCFSVLCPWVSEDIHPHNSNWYLTAILGSPHLQKPDIKALPICRMHVHKHSGKTSQRLHVPSPAGVKCWEQRCSRKQIWLKTVPLLRGGQGSKQHLPNSSPAACITARRHLQRLQWCAQSKRVAAQQNTGLYSFFHPMSPCFLPLVLLHSDMWVLIFSCRSWVFPLLHPTVSASVSLPCLPPCPSSWAMTRKLRTAPVLTSTHCSLPKLQLSQTLLPTSLPSYSHLPPFFFPCSPPFLYLSHETSFLFPSVKPAITSSFPSMSLFPCGFEPDHSFHSHLLLVKRALGAERCVNLCPGPERPGTLIIKKVIFYSGLNCSKLPDFYSQI